MHVTCPRQALSRGLSLVSHAVSNRSTLPILANILLSTDHEQLKLTGTNLEIGITAWVPAKLHEEGATTLPARFLTELVNHLPADMAELVKPADTHTMQIKTPYSHATLRGLAPDKFPSLLRAQDGESLLRLDAALLKELIAQVTIAAARDESRPVLASVLVHCANDSLTFAAADMFRLAVRSVSLPGVREERGSILIPARTMGELARILPAEGTVDMIVTPDRHQILFHTELVDLTARLTEGTFPNFRQIIPPAYTTRVVVVTRELASTIKSVALFARDSSNIVQVSVMPGDPGVLTIEARAEDVGDTVSTLAASVAGPEQSVIFNVAYLIEALAVIDTPEVALELTSPTKPAVLRPVGSPDYLYLVMPMHSHP